MKWELPSGMLEFIEQNFEVYIKEKSLKENILAKHPVPKNMKKVRKLDIFLQELMKDCKNKVEFELESIYEKI